MKQSSFLLGHPLDDLGGQVEEEDGADERDGEDHDDERVPTNQNQQKSDVVQTHAVRGNNYAHSETGRVICVEP